jgi:cytochrome c oxidase subunit 2
MQVQVTAKQFNWELAYPGPTGRSAPTTTSRWTTTSRAGRKDDPPDLKSRDVIHSFFIPNLRFKQDAVPGTRSRRGSRRSSRQVRDPCAELCGFGIRA